MKLSDVMSAAGLTIFAEAALVLFFAVFVLVCVRAAWPGNSAAWSKLGRMPLEHDDRPAAERAGRSQDAVDSERSAE